MSVMHPEGGLDVVDLTDMVGDIEIPCDWAALVAIKEHGPAAWAVHRVRCPCGYGGSIRLVCQGCKDFLLHPDAVLNCAGDCGMFYAPARRIVSSMRRL